MKIFILLLFFSTSLQAQVIKFEGSKDRTLKELKNVIKSKKVEVYNLYSRSFDYYDALPMNDIFDYVYGEKNWQKKPYIKVTATDKYTPIIELYKFQKRKAYLAYKKSNNTPFSTMDIYKEKLINLSPFYLIWEENYKKDAALRKDHWPYQVLGFSFEEDPPKSIQPDKNASKDVVWGYKNFIKQCIACHQVNGIGSEKAGEILSNKLVRKRTDLWLKKFISNPRKVNPYSKMEKFPIRIDIRKKRITDIVKYLRYLDLREQNKNKNSKSKKLNKILDNI